MQAMNELGRYGWVEYRVEYPEPKVAGMETDRVKAFQQRHSFMPGAMQLESTRWLSPASVMGPAEPIFRHGHGTTLLASHGTTGVS